MPTCLCYSTSKNSPSAVRRRGLTSDATRPPLIQHNQHNIGVVVFLTLVVSFISYARFCTLVINDITNFLGIACFTVRKKDLTGHWRRAASVDKIMVGKKQ